MNTQRYTTRQDAVEQVILPSLGEYADGHNIDAIFEACFAYDPCSGHIQDAGFVQIATEGEFWETVQRHAL